MIQEALYSRLSGFAGLTAFVSDRIYPRLMPQDPTYPAVSFFQVSATRETAMGSDPNVVHGRFQLDAWSRDVDEARNVTEQLRQALERYRGTFTVSSVTKQWFDTFIDNVQEPGTELVNAEPVYRTITDVIIHYQD